ncbi:hypothetical protein EON65_38145, partial [archaeon]
FGGWVCVSLPFCVLCTWIAWLVIIYLVPPTDITSIPIIVYERNNIITKRSVAVLSLSVLTIILFAFFQNVKNTFGDIAIIALSFVLCMFGSGMLSEVDFNSLSWHTLFLVGGGNVLGKAIGSSGLLGYLSDVITQGKKWIYLIHKLAVSYSFVAAYFNRFALGLPLASFRHHPSLFLQRRHLHLPHGRLPYSHAHYLQHRRDAQHPPSPGHWQRIQHFRCHGPTLLVLPQCELPAHRG